MSPVGWEHQALNSIQSALGHTDPKLASLLAGFSRLASSEEMPAHERVRSPLRHPPYRRSYRRRRGKALDHGRGLERTVVLIWLVTSVTLITVAVILSNGDPATCPHAFGICGVSPGANGLGLGGHQNAGARLPSIPLAGAGRDPLRPTRHAP
jgi:hypothetical protein